MMPIQKFKRAATIALIVVAAVTFSAARAQAAILTVTDLNTHVEVDSSSQAGMYEWTVDGVDQMFQQWFWYRVGDGPEASINTLAPTAAAVAGRNIITNYAGAGFTIEVTYLVTGGTANSGTSDIAETIRIINTGNAPLDFHFFQYSDFDLCGGAGGEVATFVNANTVDQTDIGGCHLSETVVTPDASHREAGIFANTLNSLNNGTPTTLIDNVSSGFGDATWAFQWDFVLGVNGSFIISKDKHLSAIPEPASLFLLGSGLLGGLKAARRRRKA
jgi:hypothetical protein